MPKPNLKNKKVLVLGGNGFVGKAAVAAFKKAGAHVGVLGSQDTYDLKNEAPKYDIFVNLAAIINSHELTPSKESQYTNVDLSRLLLEAVLLKNPKAKIIFSSSQTVYGTTAAPIITEEHPMNPETIYAKQKREAEEIYEEYARRHNMHPIVLRFANIYGPGANPKKSVTSLFVEKAKKGEEITVFGEGKDLRDYLYVDDAAAALVTAASSSLKDIFYNVGSGEYHSISDLAAAVVRLTGKGTIINKPFPKDYARYGGDLILNSDKFRTETGWKPECTLEDGLKKMI